jgi:hypothetical protein
MRANLLIGITGRKGHGKDTVGRLLRERHGFRTLAYADPLKASAKLIFGLTEEQVNGPLHVKEALDPRWGLSPREIMQRLGTEVARAIHPETWIRSAFARIDAEPERWAITDVRFRNEADAVRARGGVVVLVERPGLSTGLHEDHASERGVDDTDPDVILRNDGDLDDLAEAVDELVATLRTQGDPR